MISGIGLPYAYDHFGKEDHPDGPPFICFLYTGSDNFFADGKVYQKITGLRVELYTDEKDFALERSVEAALDAAGLCWNSSETWIESEHMYEVVYSTEIDIQDPPAQPAASQGGETNVPEQSQV
jgi:hypothetical protein